MTYLNKFATASLLGAAGLIALFFGGTMAVVSENEDSEQKQFKAGIGMVGAGVVFICWGTFFGMKGFQQRRQEYRGLLDEDQATGNQRSYNTARL